MSNVQIFERLVAMRQIVDFHWLSPTFLQFFEEASEAINVRTGQPVLEPCSVIVMDNAATHHNNGGRILSEFLNDIDIELVYMPAYSPDLTPLSMCLEKCEQS